MVNSLLIMLAAQPGHPPERALGFFSTYSPRRGTGLAKLPANALVERAFYTLLSAGTSSLKGKPSVRSNSAATPTI